MGHGVITVRVFVPDRDKESVCELQCNRITSIACFRSALPFWSCPECKSHLCLVEATSIHCVLVTYLGSRVYYVYMVDVCVHVAKSHHIQKCSLNIRFLLTVVSVAGVEVMCARSSTIYPLLSVWIFQVLITPTAHE